MVKDVVFDDAYKFLCSIGLILIALSVTIPYIFLGSELDVSSLKVLEDYTETQSKIVESRANFLLYIFSSVKVISIGMFVIGLVTLSFGFYKWMKRQEQVDKKFDLGVLELELTIEKMSAVDRLNNAKEEIAQSIIDDSTSDDLKNDGLIREEPAINRYFKLENKVISLFKGYKSKNFEVIDHIKLDNRQYIDVLFRSLNSLYLDRIVEIKMARSSNLSQLAQHTVSRLRDITEAYKEKTGRKCVAVLMIIVTSGVEYNEGVVKARIEKIISKETNRTKIFVVKEDDLLAFKVSQLLKK